MPRHEFAAQRRDKWLPQGCRATPDFAPFHPAIGSISVSHFNLTKRAKSAIVRQPCGNWLGKGQLRAGARTTASTLSGRTTTSRQHARRQSPNRLPCRMKSANALFRPGLKHRFTKGKEEADCDGDEATTSRRCQTASMLTALALLVPDSRLHCPRHRDCRNHNSQ